MSTIPVGLRIDVDTYRGTRDGVPALVDLFHRQNIQATFFMTVGPDNMGRHLWRLLKPQFLLKMLRSNAANLYGYDIILRGTAWAGPLIGHYFPDMIRMPQLAGHEVGLHAWDHYTWQTYVDKFSPEKMQEQITLGYNQLEYILGGAPQCSAAAGWRCNDRALLAKEAFGFAYNSDCRGTSIFRPVVDGKALAPQVPVTLPTYDEAIGQGGITDANYNDFILDQCKPGQLNVYTIHAEAEGIGCLNLFRKFLDSARERGIAFMPLRDLLAAHEGAIPEGRIVKREMPGREGWLAVQE